MQILKQLYGGMMTTLVGEKLPNADVQLLNWSLMTLWNRSRPFRTIQDFKVLVHQECDQISSKELSLTYVQME